MKKHNFRSGIKIFALGAFTGYPVLPGVSAPLSDGDREYREKQMIIATVCQQPWGVYLLRELNLIKEKKKARTQKQQPP